MNIIRAPYKPRTFARLNDIVTVLGGTKMAFWPFLNGGGGNTYPYGSGNDGILLAANTSTLELVFDPVRHEGGVYSYMNDSATANLAAADNANFTHGNATVDTAFSIGIWILMQEAVGTARSLMAKYGSTGTAREYDFRFGTDSKGGVMFTLVTSKPVIKDGQARWEPAFDLNRTVFMGQLVAIVFLLTVRTVVKALAKRR